MANVEMELKETKNDETKDDNDDSGVNALLHDINNPDSIVLCPICDVNGDNSELLWHEYNASMKDKKWYESIRMYDIILYELIAEFIVIIVR